MKTKKTIKILGSGTCVPSLRRSACSVLIEGEKEIFLVDSGPGTLRQLLKAGHHISDIDAVFLSHFHVDHTSDLPALLFAIKYPNMTRKKEKLILTGGTGLTRFYTDLDRAWENTLELDGFLEIIELPSRSREPLVFSEFTVEFEKPVHKTESRAFKFIAPDGFTIVYSGDTDFSENLVKLAHNADVLIIESALPDHMKVAGHLTPSLAGDIAARANVKHLVLTHFYPECEKADMKKECRKTFSGEISLAEDLLELRF